MSAKIKLSREDTLPFEIQQYFLITDFLHVSVTERNLHHYSHLDAKIGDKIEKGVLRNYQATEDLEKVFEARFSEEMKIPETTEKDFLQDELRKIESWRNSLLEINHNHQYKNVLSRYRDLLEKKLFQQVALPCSIETSQKKHAEKTSIPSTLIIDNTKAIILYKALKKFFAPVDHEQLKLLITGTPIQGKLQFNAGTAQLADFFGRLQKNHIVEMKMGKLKAWLCNSFLATRTRNGECVGVELNPHTVRQYLNGSRFAGKNKKILEDFPV